MSNKLHKLIQAQNQVKVAQLTQAQPKDEALLITLAFALVGVFYFFGYYFWDMIGRVLAAY